MTDSGRSLPQVTPFGVSARFVDQHAAGAATRALQKTLGIPTEAIGVAAEPGAAAAAPSPRDAALGEVRGGAVIVNVSVPDGDTAARVKELLLASGGAELSRDEPGSPSVGGYGPTTAHGRAGLIGAAPGTSAMAERSYQDALEGRDREEQERRRDS